MLSTGGATACTNHSRQPLCCPRHSRRAGPHLADDLRLGRQAHGVALGHRAQAVVDALKQRRVLPEVAPRLGLRAKGLRI